MRVFLTGATGFVGSRLLRKLVEAGHEVAILARRGSDPRRIADLLPRVVRIQGTLEAIAAAEPQLADFRPEAVAHLAWGGVGNKHRNDPSQVDNVGPSLELVRIAHRVGAGAWIGLGSQAEYGPRDGQTDESTPTQPTTLYGVAKLGTGMIAGRLCDELGLRFAWLRLFSSYGPGDDAEWMIPYLILKLLRRERPSLTEGRQRWDYIFVDDAADAIYRAVVTPTARGLFNLGSGDAPTIRQVVERIRDLIDPALELGFGEVPYRPDQVMHLQADVRRLRDELGWSARVGLDEGLTRTVEFYRDDRAA